MTMLKRKKGYFSISAVAKMFSVHQQTIRLYEKEGLISPKRSNGNTRLFSEEDVNRLEEIVYLTHQLGINLAGVQMVFKLKRQLSKMQKEMNKIFETTQKDLDFEVENSKQMVSSSAKQLMKIKKNSAIDTTAITPSQSQEIMPISETQAKIFATDDWEIEYEE